MAIASSEFKEGIQKIAYSIGFRDALSPTDVDMIFNFIKRSFKNLNLSEIYKAFELYSAQKLDFKDHHFNSFDRIFTGKVINSYLNFNKIQFSKPKQYEPERDNRTKYTYEEGKKAYYHVEEIILSEFKMPLIACWIHCARFMEENGYINLEDVEREAKDNFLMEEFKGKKKRGKNKITGLMEGVFVDSTFEVFRAKFLIREYFSDKLRMQKKNNN